MTGNKLCKPAQRSGAGLHIICYPSSDVFNKLTKLNNYQGFIFTRYRVPVLARADYFEWC